MRLSTSRVGLSFSLGDESGDLAGNLVTSKAAARFRANRNRDEFLLEL